MWKMTYFYVILHDILFYFQNVNLEVQKIIAASCSDAPSPFFATKATEKKIYIFSKITLLSSAILPNEVAAGHMSLFEFKSVSRE